MTYTIKSLKDADAETLLTFCIYTFCHTYHNDYSIFNNYFTIEPYHIDEWNMKCNDSKETDDIADASIHARSLLNYLNTESEYNFNGMIEMNRNDEDKIVSLLKNMIYYMNNNIGFDCIGKIECGKTSIKIKNFLKTDNESGFHIHIKTDNNEYVIISGDFEVYIKMLENADKSLKIDIVNHKMHDNKIINYGRFISI